MRKEEQAILCHCFTLHFRVPLQFLFYSISSWQNEINFAIQWLMSLFSAIFPSFVLCFFFAFFVVSLLFRLLLLSYPLLIRRLVGWNEFFFVCCWIEIVPTIKSKIVCIWNNLHTKCFITIGWMWSYFSFLFSGSKILCALPERFKCYFLLSLSRSGSLF